MPDGHECAEALVEPGMHGQRGHLQGWNQGKRTLVQAQVGNDQIGLADDVVPKEKDVEIERTVRPPQARPPPQPLPPPPLLERQQLRNTWILFQPCENAWAIPSAEHRLSRQLRLSCNVYTADPMAACI